MSLGKPVLATRVAGNVDLIRDGENGFLFSGQEEFVDKATRYIEDEQLRHEMASSGQMWVQEHYSVEREIQTFKHIYDEVMNLRYSFQRE
jgi:glycosyltransferase involved in cell wall biosynthesis